MVGIKVIALTGKGYEALKQAVDENKVELMNMKALDRAIFKAFFIDFFTANEYLFRLRSTTLNVPGVNIRGMKKDFELKLEAISYEIELALTSNGALKGIDYTIEVI
jgi:hypothetical protein